MKTFIDPPLHPVCHPERKRGIPLMIALIPDSKGILRRARQASREASSHRRQPRTTQDDMNEPFAPLLGGFLTPESSR